MPQIKKNSTLGPIGFIALMALLIPLELACASIARYWISPANCFVAAMAVVLNIIPIVFYVNKHRPVAIISALLLACLIVPDSIIGGLQLFFLQREAGSVVAYVYETKLKTGNYPGDLSAYKFFVPTLKENFAYFRDTQSGFRVAYTVTGSNTDYWYEPELGWNYHND